MKQGHAQLQGQTKSGPPSPLHHRIRIPEETLDHQTKAFTFPDPASRKVYTTHNAPELVRAPLSLPIELPILLS